MIRSHRVLIAVTTVAASSCSRSPRQPLTLRPSPTRSGSSSRAPSRARPSRALATAAPLPRLSLSAAAMAARSSPAHARATKSRVADFPAYVAGPGAPRAVVGVVNKGKERLAPGGKAFTIGIDFRVDAAAIAATDDGNNLLQRGNFGSPSQYKLQVDDGRVGCRIKGAKGDTLLVAPTVLTPDRWYRSQCSLKKKSGSCRRWCCGLDGSTSTPSSTWSSAPTISQMFGSLTFPKKRPLTIGGKLKDRLRIPGRAEQFNGQLDSAYFRIN